jgi:transcriptional regulator with XRE-family HTH domain
MQETRVATRSEPELVPAPWWQERPVILARLRRLRTTRSMTAAALAQQAGVPTAAIVRLEAGGVARRQEVTVLAEALGVSPEQIIGPLPRMG